MADKTSTCWTIYKGCGSNPGRGFNRDRGNLCGRGQGRGFNLTKTKVREKFEDLGSGVYLIGDAWQPDKQTKTTEVILNYIQGNFKGGNNVKESF